MRDFFKNGRLRHPISILLGLVVVFVVYFFWNTWITNNIDPLSSAQKIAFIAAAFSVTSYNLRAKVVDVIGKIDSTPDIYDNFMAIAKECGKKSTNLIVFFTATAFLLGVVGFIPIASPVAKWAFMFVGAAFVYACVQFIYILFAFERLEDFILSEGKRRSLEKESDRLFKE